MINLHLNDIADSLIILNKQTVERLFEMGTDAFTLYSFYYKTAKWQKTNRIKANDIYIKKCLKWGDSRVRKAKQILKENGLISIIQSRKAGRIAAWYIEIFFIITENTTSKIEVQQPSTQQLSIPTSSKEETNALINKIEMLKETNKELKAKIAMLENTNLTNSDGSFNFNLGGKYKYTDVPQAYKDQLKKSIDAFLLDVENKLIALGKEVPIMMDYEDFELALLSKGLEYTDFFSAFKAWHRNNMSKRFHRGN